MQMLSGYNHTIVICVYKKKGVPLQGKDLHCMEQKQYTYIGIIPARYASTRFPGKPLVDICGKPMIQRVYEQARKVLAIVIVATDDERIRACVQGFGGQVVMTSPSHKCGTDRVEEAYEIYMAAQTRPLPDDEVVVINIQGDEPFIQPFQIEAIMSCFPTEIATLVKPFTAEDTLEDLMNPNSPKVVFSGQTGEAIYFSRSVIPYLRGVDKSEWLLHGKFYRHIGMYAYRADVLKRITHMSQTPLELAESLEQLRWIEKGVKVKVAVCDAYSMGIDTPEDLQEAIQYLNMQ